MGKDSSVCVYLRWSAYVMLLLGQLAAATQCSASSKVAIADVNLRGGGPEGNPADKDTVYGANKELSMKLDMSRHSWSSFNTVACFKFATSDLGAVGSAVARFYVTRLGRGYGGPVTSMVLTAFTTPESVDEASSTWNSFGCSESVSSSPCQTSGSEIISSGTPMAAAWFNVNVTDHLLASRYADGNLALCLEVSTNENFAAIASREHSEMHFRPRLDVTCSNTTLPATASPTVGPAPTTTTTTTTNANVSTIFVAWIMGILSALLSILTIVVALQCCLMHQTPDAVVQPVNTNGEELNKDGVGLRLKTMEESRRWEMNREKCKRKPYCKLMAESSRGVDTCGGSLQISGRCARRAVSDPPRCRDLPVTVWDA